MPRYGEASHESVERAMRKRKHGTLRSGRSGRKVSSRKQAIAIGLNEARESGDKVPGRSRTRKRTTRRASSTRRGSSTRRASSHSRKSRSSSSRRSRASR